MKLQMPNAQHALKRKKGFCGFLIIITIFVIRKRTSSSAFYSLPSFSAKPLAGMQKDELFQIFNG
jgi:hypothetical protein